MYIYILCMYVGKYICVHARRYVLCMHAYMCIYMCVLTDVFSYLRMCVRKRVCMYEY